MFRLAAEMIREAWSLEVCEERGVVRTPEDSAIQQHMKERAPPGCVPCTLKERALRVDGFACQHALDASSRMHGEAKHLDHGANKALGHAGVQHARSDR